jgi:hypothetical protein
MLTATSLDRCRAIVEAGYAALRDRIERGSLPPATPCHNLGQQGWLAGQRVECWREWYGPNRHYGIKMRRVRFHGFDPQEIDATWTRAWDEWREWFDNVGAPMGGSCETYQDSDCPRTDYVYQFACSPEQVRWLHRNLLAVVQPEGADEPLPVERREPPPLAAPQPGAQWCGIASGGDLFDVGDRWEWQSPGGLTLTAAKITASSRPRETPCACQPGERCQCHAARLLDGAEAGDPVPAPQPAEREVPDNDAADALAYAVQAKETVTRNMVRGIERHG